MTRFDTIIKGGTVFDGSRIPRFHSDIGIKDGVIGKIGILDEKAADKVIDATGLNVAPGFIDLHTHYDAQLFWDPYCSLSSWHGITSAVIGNCGFGFAPVRPDERERTMLSMTRVEAIPLESMKAGMPWDWVTFPEYLDSIERTPKAINILPYVPIAPLLVWVLGREDAKAGRMPTAEEESEICRLFAASLDAGGCGWSAQRLPPDGPASVQLDYDGTAMPTDVMHDETCLALARVLGERGEGFMQMTITTGDGDADRRHIEELARISARPLLFNVVQAFADRPHVHRKTLDWLNSCHRRGIRVYGQGLTTDAGFTFSLDEWNLWDDSPAWREATVGTVAERKAKLADPERRARLREKLPQIATGPMSEVVLVRPHSPENEKFTDHKISLIAKKTGKHPVDALLDIAVESDLKAEFFAMPPNAGNVDLLREIIDDPYVLFGVSDGGAHTRFLTAGRYPTEALITCVREHLMLSLEEAHWRLSALPAMMAGFTDRGILREGAPADIVVYDFENLEVMPGEIAHDLPGNEWRRVQRARGYRYILVNGEVTIEDDTETGICSGHLLRHGRG